MIFFMIIGVTGSFAAGKDTVGEYLKDKGFAHHSLSDILREEIKKEGEQETRENLIAKGNEIRTKFGAGELAKRTIEKIESNRENLAVVTSVRNPEEVNRLRERKDFVLIFVDAPIRMRYDRLARRTREGDITSFEDFVEKEKIENSSDPNAQQLNKVAEMADVTIVNDDSLKSLYEKVDELINSHSRS